MKLAVLASAMLLLAACGSPSNGTASATSTTASPTARISPVAEPTSVAEAAPVVAASPATDEIYDGLTEMVGTWKVTAVHVKPSDVQALVENDPTDIGAMLDIARDRLSWRPRAEGNFSDVCTAPRLTPDGQIACKDSEFGPPGARLIAQGDRLKLDWYDGATLELRRQR